jgi:hypothetical protein
MQKKRILPIMILAAITLIFFFTYQSCRYSRISEGFRNDTLYTNTAGKGNTLELQFIRGPEHNHPLMAAWIEDTSGKYIQTLYVAESIAKGVFNHGDKSTGKWMPGPVRRPAALPVWAFSRGVKEADSLYVPTRNDPVLDAYTGATPQANFVLIAKTDKPLPKKFFVYFEINQPWDWNSYWTNNKYPDDEEYKTSCQPALVYRAQVSTDELHQSKSLELIGHSHYSGANGEINSDLSTITTAKDITQSVSVSLLD